MKVVWNPALPSREEIETRIREDAAMRPQEPIKATVFHRSGFVHGEMYVLLTADGLPEKVFYKGVTGVLVD